MTKRELNKRRVQLFNSLDFNSLTEFIPKEDFPVESRVDDVLRIFEQVTGVNIDEEIVKGCEFKRFRLLFIDYVKAYYYMLNDCVYCLNNELVPEQKPTKEIIDLAMNRLSELTAKGLFSVAKGYEPFELYYGLTLFITDRTRAIFKERKEEL